MPGTCRPGPRTPSVWRLLAAMWFRCSPGILFHQTLVFIKPLVVIKTLDASLMSTSVSRLAASRSQNVPAALGCDGVRAVEVVTSWRPLLVRNNRWPRRFPGIRPAFEHSCSTQAVEQVHQRDRLQFEAARRDRTCDQPSCCLRRTAQSIGARVVPRPWRDARYSCASRRELSEPVEPSVGVSDEFDLVYVGRYGPKLSNC